MYPKWIVPFLVAFVVPFASGAQEGEGEKTSPEAGADEAAVAGDEDGEEGEVVRHTGGAEAEGGKDVERSYAEWVTEVAGSRDCVQLREALWQAASTPPADTLVASRAAKAAGFTLSDETLKNFSFPLEDRDACDQLGEDLASIWAQRTPLDPEAGDDLQATLAAVQPAKGPTAGASSSAGQIAASPTVAPSAFVSGSLSAAGTGDGPGGAASLSFNPAAIVSMLDPDNAAATTRFNDLTFLVPTDLEPGEFPEYFGIRARFDFAGLAQGLAIGKGVRELKTLVREVDLVEAGFGDLLADVARTVEARSRNSPGGATLGDCWTSLLAEDAGLRMDELLADPHACALDETTVTQISGAHRVRTESESAEDGAEAGEDARAVAELRQLQLSHGRIYEAMEDIRDSMGNASAGLEVAWDIPIGVLGPEGDSDLPNHLAFAFAGGAQLNPKSRLQVGLYGRAGLDLLLGGAVDDVADAGVVYGGDLTFDAFFKDQHVIHATVGVLGRAGEETSLYPDLQGLMSDDGNYTALALSASIPLLGDTGMGLGVTLPLDGESQPTFAVTTDFAYLVKDD